MKNTHQHCYPIRPIQLIHDPANRKFYYRRVRDLKVSQLFDESMEARLAFSEGRIEWADTKRSRISVTSAIAC